jgi:arylsulfatase A
MVNPSNYSNFMTKVIMNRIIALFILFVVNVSVTAQETKQPNIIIIFADDLGYGDIQGYGAAYPTPNFDKLQKEGMKFTNFYSQPQCSPSRAALMTGCYPQRVGIPWVVGPEGPAWTRDKSFIGLNPEEKTLPEMLKEKDYATACIGKWHLGHHAQHLPTRHGFDEYFGLPYSNDMWPPNNADFPPLPLLDGEKEIEKNPDQTQLTKRYTERAVSFITKNKSRPFFLYLAHAMPHVPIYASQRFVSKSGKGLFADVVQEMDWSTGEIMDALKKHGVDKNTILIFTSDNGPWLTYGNHAGSAGGFREGKGTTFEGGVRVPFIARWPDHITAGSTCHAVGALFDLLPTFAEITQAKLSSNTLDGKSILPLLLGKSTQASREVHYYFQINELQAVRKGKWKLHFPHTYEHVTESGKDGERGKTTSIQLDLSLFDLEADPSEQKNVGPQHPEMVEALKVLGENFKSEIIQHKRQPGKSF